MWRVNREKRLIAERALHLKLGIESMQNSLCELAGELGFHASGEMRKPPSISICIRCLGLWERATNHFKHLFTEKVLYVRSPVVMTIYLGEHIYGEDTAQFELCIHSYKVRKLNNISPLNRSKDYKYLLKPTYLAKLDPPTEWLTSRRIHYPQIHRLRVR